MSSGLAEHLRRLREIGGWDVPGEEQRRRALIARVHRRLLIHAATLAGASAVVVAAMTLVVIDPRPGGDIDDVPPRPVLGEVRPGAVNGWHSGSISVHWTCHDDRSGVSHDGRPVPAELEGKRQRVAIVCSDAAGNSARDEFVLDIDRTSPVGLVVSPHPPPDANRWYRAPMTVEWTCVDRESGPRTPGRRQTVVDEGRQAVSSGCTDVAGNVDKVPVPVNLDFTAPTIGDPLQDPPANKHGWNRSPVTVRWSCTDSPQGSGVRARTATARVAVEGRDLVARGTCEDRVGNTAIDESRLLNIDMTPPPDMSVTRRPRPNAAGWNNEPVEVTFSCTDELSGVLSIAPRSATLDRAGKDQEVESRCNDYAGNGRVRSESVSIDLIDPTVRIDDPDVPVMTQDRRVTGAASDDLSGVRLVKVTYTNRLNSRRHIETGQCAADGCATWSAALPPCGGLWDVTAASTDFADNESDPVAGPGIVVAGDPQRCSNPVAATSAPMSRATGARAVTERADRSVGRETTGGARAGWRLRSVRELDDRDHRRADGRDDGRGRGHHDPARAP